MDHQVTSIEMIIHDSFIPRFCRTTAGFRNSFLNRNGFKRQANHPRMHSWKWCKRLPKMRVEVMYASIASHHPSPEEVCIIKWNMPDCGEPLKGLKKRLFMD
ncbi:MAG: hypothetical protein A2Z14_10905 [Chloroflexi bacterium RBG_16_48_8]|nr:MAG: hypothetical protein A2Z14_10905 [Chloroflexi bacterium RBG_16_48_8]